MSGEICLPGESAGTERALVVEVQKEWGHGLDVIATVALFTKGSVFEGVVPGGVVAFPMGVELMKFVGGKWGDMKE